MASKVTLPVTEAENDAYLRQSVYANNMTNNKH